MADNEATAKSILSDNSSEKAEVISDERIGSSNPAPSSRYYMKMKYQERQFLRSKDFQEEQAYHIRKLRDHNRLLHQYGICEGGLEVSKIAATNLSKCVEVSAGSAIDRLGNPILLNSTETLDLSTACAKKTKVILTIRYGEANATDTQYNVDEGGFTGCTRTIEKPIFEVYPVDEPSLDTDQLVLAQIERKADGTILSCDNSEAIGRRSASVKIADVDSSNLVDKSVLTRHLADGAVIAGKIAGKTITATQIADATITATQIANATISAGKITGKTITAAQLADKTIATTQIADNTIRRANTTISQVVNEITVSASSNGTYTGQNSTAYAFTADQIIIVEVVPADTNNTSHIINQKEVGNAQTDVFWVVRTYYSGATLAKYVTVYNKTTTAKAVKVIFWRWNS